MLSYSILSHSILSHSTVLYSILSHSILFGSTPRFYSTPHALFISLLLSPLPSRPARKEHANYISILFYSNLSFFLLDCSLHLTLPFITPPYHYTLPHSTFPSLASPYLTLSSSTSPYLISLCSILCYRHVNNMSHHIISHRPLLCCVVLYCIV